MSLLQYAFLALTFVAVFGVVMVAAVLTAPSAARKRVQDLNGAATGRTNAAWLEKAAKVSAPFAKLSLPDEGWEKSGIRARFMHAGLRHPSAPLLYFGAKTFLAVALPALAFVLIKSSGANLQFQQMLSLLLLATAAGYYIPNMVFSRLVLSRQREIFESFPDALDLMTVCVEAGLGIEAALNKVAEDMEHRSPTLSEELRLVGLELRAGSDRQRALRNLAARTGVAEVESWAVMLIQAERFGTSIAGSLRVYSDALRTKRRQRAEEEAAKIGLKLLFPLIFCLFPSLMLVLLGPAFIQIYQIMLPAMSGGGGH